MVYLKSQFLSILFKTSIKLGLFTKILSVIYVISFSIFCLEGVVY